MDIKSISATLALLSGSAATLPGCDSAPKAAATEIKPTKSADTGAPSKDAKVDDTKGEMSCAPGMCGADKADKKDAEGPKPVSTAPPGVDTSAPSPTPDRPIGNAPTQKLVPPSGS